MRTLHFGPFELDTAAGELRRRRRLVPLEPQPLRLLTLLATRAGEVVTRETVERELWPDGIAVDVEHGINTCISQIRRALGDRAARPRFVETLPRRGYRFMPGVSRGARRNLASPRGRMFGRDDTLKILAEDYARVASQRRGRMVCLTGEPGIGKTTVCEAFAARLRSTGDPKPYVARGRCSERLAGTEAYLPWLEAFERLIDDDPSGEVDRLMRGVAPSWFVQITPSGEGQPRLASLSQEQLKRELATFLTRLSAHRPVVIWFEDLHWADASTVDLLAYAGGRFDEMALLLLVTYRQTELLMAGHPFTTVRLDLEGRGSSRELALAFLGRDDVRQYVDAEFPGHGFPSAFPDLLHARTEGSPLFVVDSVEHLRTRGIIVQSNDGWRLAESLPDLEHDLPQSIRSVIERKLRLLETADTQLLETAAVQGYDFDSAVVADVSGVDALDAEARLAELARVHRLVIPTGERRLPDGTPTQEFRFVHVLYQNVLYAGLTPTRRSRVSLAVAEELLTRHAGRVASIASSLARLFEAGGDAKRAIEYFLIAARQAAAVFANPEVAALAECGLRLLPQLEDANERDRRELELRMMLGPALMALRFSAEAVGENFTRAESLCGRFDDVRELAIPLLGLIVFRHVRAEYEESCRLLERLARIVEPLDDSTLHLRTHNDFGVNLFLMGRLADARMRLTKGLDIYLADPALHHARLVLHFGLDAAAIGMAYLAYTDAIEGWPVRSQRHIDTAFAQAQTHPFTSALLLAFALMIGFTWHEVANVRRRAEQLVALCEEHGFAGQSAFGRFFIGWARAEQGELEAGLAVMAEARQQLIDIGNNVFSSLHPLGLASALRRQGRLPDALAVLESGEAFVTRSGERIFQSEFLRVRGLIAHDDGDRIAAVSAFERALEVARSQGARLFELRAATTLVECGGSEGRRFREDLERAYAFFREALDRPDLQRARAALDVCG